jgi:AGCS family alanine or glycine:cation symporter
MGATVMMAVRYGVARGFYSNEAGTGSAAIMYSTAKTDNVYYQSLISMFGVFIDTVVSTFTLLIILVTGVWTSGLTSTALTASAFKDTFGAFGGKMLALSSFLLGYSTLIAWCFYGEQCFAYLWGPRVKKYFRWAFSLIIILGFMRVEFVWSVGDILNATIITLNLIALVFLVKTAYEKTKGFRRERRKKPG